MRNRILAIAAVAAIAAPAAAFAQDEVTVGVAPGPAVVMPGAAPGIAVEQRPAFREYVVREHVPAYTMPERVIVGGVLPDTVTYYDVTGPQGQLSAFETFTLQRPRSDSRH